MKKFTCPKCGKEEQDKIECRAIYSEEFHLGQCGNCGSVLKSYDLYEVETCPECGAHIIEVFEF